MTLEELIDTAREDFLDDDEEPYLWSKEALTRAANRAEREVCKLARILPDSSTPALTRISLVVGQLSYKLDRRIVDILDGDVRLTTLQKELRKYSYRDFQNESSQWDTLSANPRAFCLDWQRGYLTLDRLPTAVDTAKLRVIRLPLEDMAELDDSPEIPLEYHDFLPEMMVYFAYQKADSETLNKDAVARYYTICFDPRNPNSYIEQIKRMESQQKKTLNRKTVLQRMAGALKTGGA